MSIKKLNRIQEEELEILKSVVALLEEKQLTYFLYGGSLLGAIRHKGFIPWDDDIDIAMPRNDYEKFINIAKKNPYLLKENLVISSMDINRLVKPFCKVINRKIPIDEENKIDKYLWIDIFPIDGLPKNQLKTKIIYKLEHLYKLLIGLKETKKEKNSGLLKNYAKKIIKKYTNSFYLLKKMDLLAKKHSYDECEMVGNVVWGYGPQEKIEKKELEIMEVEFEGLKVNGIKGYDKYLTNVYGDYMTLPPEDKRVTHSFTIKERDENEEI